MGKFRDTILNEIGETTESFNWREEKPGVFYMFDTPGYEYKVKLERRRPRELYVGFRVSWDDIEPGANPFEVTTDEGQMFKVVATIIDIVRYAWKNKERFYENPEELEFISFEGYSKGNETHGEDTARNKLYKQFIRRQFPNAEIMRGRDSLVKVKPNV